MADFCKQCSIDVYGEDMKDLSGLSTELDTNGDLYPVVLCEGCGPTQVDHTGVCVSPDCSNHGN